VQAIELVRTVAGCRLAEATAVVDRLSRTGDRPIQQGEQSAPQRRTVQFPPGYDLAPARPAERPTAQESE
jgi:hypothetical protein